MSSIRITAKAGVDPAHHAGAAKRADAIGDGDSFAAALVGASAAPDAAAHGAQAKADDATSEGVPGDDAQAGDSGAASAAGQGGDVVGTAASTDSKGAGLTAAVADLVTLAPSKPGAVTAGTSIGDTAPVQPRRSRAATDAASAAVAATVGPVILSPMPAAPATGTAAAPAARASAQRSATSREALPAIAADSGQRPHAASTPTDNAAPSQPASGLAPAIDAGQPIAAEAVGSPTVAAEASSSISAAVLPSSTQPAVVLPDAASLGAALAGPAQAAAAMLADTGDAASGGSGRPGGSSTGRDERASSIVAADATNPTAPASGPAGADTPAGVQAAGSQGPVDPNAVNFPDRLSDQVVRLLTNSGREAVMRLHPPELGEVTIRIAVSGRDVSTWFGSSQPQVQQTISAAIGQLQTDLGNAGYSLNGAWVGADTSGSGQRAVPLPETQQQSATREVLPVGFTASRPAASGVSIYV